MEAEIDEHALAVQRRIDSGEQAVVGLNRHVMPTPPSLLRKAPATRDMHETEEIQMETLARLRAERDADATATARSTGSGRRPTEKANTIPPIIAAVRANATVGEICQALADVWGRFGANHS